jgi:hypothetical protein
MSHLFNTSSPPGVFLCLYIIVDFEGIRPVRDRWTGR